MNMNYDIDTIPTTRYNSHVNTDTTHGNQNMFDTLISMVYNTTIHNKLEI